MIPINYCSHVLCFRCLLELMQREDGQWLDTQWLLNQTGLPSCTVAFSIRARDEDGWSLMDPQRWSQSALSDSKVHESYVGSGFFGNKWRWKQKCLTTTYWMQKQVISHVFVLVTFLPWSRCVSWGCCYVMATPCSSIILQMIAECATAVQSRGFTFQRWPAMQSDHCLVDIQVKVL